MRSSQTAFKKQHFDGLATLSQIILLQNYSFLLLSVAILVTLSMLNLGPDSKLSLDFLLDHSKLSFNTLLGWTLCFVYLTHAGITLPFAMLYIVQRSRLCLDFGCTVWGIHLIFGWWWYGKFPASLFYWIVFFACTSLTVYCSQELCMKEELKPIMLSGGGAANPRSPKPVATPEQEQVQQGNRRGMKTLDSEDIEMSLLKNTI